VTVFPFTEITPVLISTSASRLEQIPEAAINLFSLTRSGSFFAGLLPAGPDALLPDGFENPLPEGLEDPLPEGPEDPLPEGPEDPLPEGLEDPLPGGFGGPSSDPLPRTGLSPNFRLPPSSFSLLIFRILIIVKGYKDTAN
jgi:hypothetical protein